MNIFVLYFATLSLKNRCVLKIDLVNDVKKAAFEIATNLCKPILIIQGEKSQFTIDSQYPCFSMVYCTTKSPPIALCQIHEYAQVLFEDARLLSVYSGSNSLEVCFCYLSEDDVSSNTLKQLGNVQQKPILLYEGANPNVADLIDGCTEWLHIRLAPPD